MNRSQQQRDELLGFLKDLRQQHNDDDSLARIKQLENALCSKRYGLVWEEHSEEVEEMLRENIPVFEEDLSREINREREREDSHSCKCNFLIEGDNLHSLHLLQKTHRGKIDVIYIDPPYNTGSDDFCYDDKRIDENDAFRHSKWLSFMEKRIILARELLSEYGLIFVSIDDHEFATLKILMDTIFSEENFIVSLPRITKKSGKTTDSFSKNHDYVLAYVKASKDIFAQEEHNDPGFKYEDEWIAERGKFKLNQTLDYDSLQYSTSLDYPLSIDGETFYPGGNYEDWERRQRGNHRRADWAWRWCAKKFEFGYKNGFIVVKRKQNGSARIYTKSYLNANISQNADGSYYIEYCPRTKAFSSIGFIENQFSNDNAKKDLKSFGLSEEFDYSKPVSLIKRLLKSHFNKNATVLDFFAGSGTTGEAVLQLNEEDGGNRNFILCTNNENGICDKVTYQRQKTCITGVRKDGNKYSDGFPAHLKYYRTAFIPKATEDLDEQLLAHVKELIQLEHGLALDPAKHLLIFSDEDADQAERDWEHLSPTLELIFIADDVLLSARQKRLFAPFSPISIPDYYFKLERDEAERRLWED